MAKTMVIDEIHLTLRIPNDLPDDAAEAVRETITDDEFMERLRRAMRTVLREFPTLAGARVSLAR